MGGTTVKLKETVLTVVEAVTEAWRSRRKNRQRNSSKNRRSSNKISIGRNSDNSERNSSETAGVETVVTVARATQQQRSFQLIRAHASKFIVEN